MIRFTFKMMLLDLQSLFKGYWILLYLAFLSFSLSSFFISDNPLTLFYVSFVCLSFLMPQLPKLFYVLPFDKRLIRRYLHLRGLLSCLLIFIIGGLITLISLWDPVPYPEQGWRSLILFAQLCIMLSIAHVKAPDGKKRKVILLVTLSILQVIVHLVCLIAIKDVTIMLAVSFLLLVSNDLLVYRILNFVELKNYTAPVYWYNYNNKKLRQNTREGGQRS